MICEICKQEFETKRGLASHIQKVHKVKLEQYTIDYLLDGSEPKCPICDTKPRYVSFTFKKYCKEHSHLAESEAGKVGGAMKQTWNRGKTKQTDERIAIQAKNQLGEKNHMFGTGKPVNREFLTEKKLGEALKLIFPEHTFIEQKSVRTDDKFTCRPDFYCDELKMIVEFDGFEHYRHAVQTIRDKKKDFYFKEILGYRVIRIPFFVQLSAESIEYFFGVKTTWEQIYPHGFIDKAVYLPADFCYLGLERYKEEISGLPPVIVSEINASLRDKIKFFGDPLAVTPPTLSTN